jgi:septum formation protein
MTLKHLADLTKHFPLVLASGSPRRFELLTETGVPFSRIIPDLEEARQPHESPFAYAKRLAEDKALAVAGRVDNGAVCLGSDTVVALGEENLEKPIDDNDAFRILSLLSGKQHVVCTALAFAHKDRLITSGYETTKVFFNLVTEQQIRDYVKTGEPADKAGAYGIQGMGAFLVDRIDGNLDTVIGLPRNLLNTLARDAANILQVC